MSFVSINGEDMPEKQSKSVVLSPEKMAAAKILAAKLVGLLVCTVAWLVVLGLPILAIYLVGSALSRIGDALSAPLHWLANTAERLKNEAEPLIAEIKAARAAAKASAQGGDPA